MKDAIITPEPRILDAGDYHLLAGLPILQKFFVIKKENSLYYYKESRVLSILNNAGPYFLQENVLSCEDKNIDLHMNYTVNMAVVNYFGTQIPEIEKIDGHMEIESAKKHGKDLP